MRAFGFARFLVAAALLTGSPSIGHSQDLSKKFPVGEGSQFTLKMAGTSTTLFISIAQASPKRVSIEYYFQSASVMAPVEFWQQFTLESQDKGPLRLTGGYIYAKELKGPEKIPDDRLHGAGTVGMDDFLFAEESDLNALKRGLETVTVPAGTLKAVHYQKTRNGQAIDFWISKEAAPIGAVKVVSKGPRMGQNYELELESLLKNVKPRIDPSQAVPLSEAGKKFLATNASR